VNCGYRITSHLAGVFGSLMGTPILNPPQAAILGMHAVNDRPVAINGQVGAQRCLTQMNAQLMILE
jgi:pyruvate/2-oxoglutarate dehydrogenase complex dihydrolipoamide acyltransferase (E2) component